MVQHLTPEPTLIFQHFYRLADRILTAWDAEVTGEDETNPRLIILAVQDLQTLLADLHARYQDDPPRGEITRGVDYGIQLFSELTRLAMLIRIDEAAVEVENLAFPFALWGVRLGAEITTLEPVVNAIARLANNRQSPGFLEELYREVSEIMLATAIELKQENLSSQAMNPWRILLLNRAIIATRSHHLTLIDDAFSSIVEYLPSEATGFFREGMEQMDIIGYPAHVRDVVTAWYERYASKPTLH